MYQEKSSKLFLSRFPLQSPFAPCLWIGHCPLSGGRENTFPSGTQCRAPEPCAMVTLCVGGGCCFHSDVQRLFLWGAFLLMRLRHNGSN